MHSLTLPILRRLSDGNFHSGEDLAVHFGVSRASICNALKDVNQLGVTVYKVRGRGYQLPTTIEWLDAALISRDLADHGNPLSVQVMDVVTSTNAILMRQVPQLVGRQCLAAELQTHGRGRRGKSWHSPLGGALTFSLAWQFNMTAAQLSGLSLAVGVALLRALKEIGITQVQLKWPNDLMFNFQKLGGILVELQGEALGPSMTVIGVGLNLQLNHEIKDRIDQAVTDVATAAKISVPRNVLLSVVLRHMVTTLEAFAHGGFQAIKEEWQEHHAYHERAVNLQMADGARLPGVVKGVAADGSLIMETAQGVKTFGSGEVSLRPQNTVGVGGYQ